jgi:hypothetical protein
MVFDFDALRGNDVRVVVDGDEVARFPCPTAESPRQEVSLSVEGHQLLAVAEARNRGELLIYDLFHDDRSLKNGATLGRSRAAAPIPGARTPLAHGIVEATIQIATVGGASGIGAGAVGGIGRLGWPMTILVVAVGLGLLWLGSAGARFVWNWVLRRRGWPAWRQSITGLAGVIAAFVVAYGAWILLVITIARRPNLEF